MNELNGSARQLDPAPFDAWAVLDFWRRRWYWLAAWTLVLAVAGGVIARLVWKPTYTATAQLVRYEPSTISDAFRPRDLATPSLVLMLQSPELFGQIGAQLSPPASSAAVAHQVELRLDRNNEVAMVVVNGAERDSTVELVNLYCAAAIGYTQTIQKQEAKEAEDYVLHQLAQVDNDLKRSINSSTPAQAAAALAAVPVDDQPEAAAPADLTQRVDEARERLADLLVRYTDAHPLVREQKARLAALQDLQKSYAAKARAVHKSTPLAPAIDPSLFGRITPEEVALGERLRTLETDRSLLIARQRAIEPFLENPPGYFHVLVPPASDRTYQHNHRLEAGLCAMLGAFLGLVGAGGQILLGEFLDNRVKTRGDVRRVTGLPLVATLGDLNRMSQAERDQWAFRTWTALQSRLSPTPNHGMVCGITSAHPDDGRSTWVDLLARAASACGFRVLTITAQRPQALGVKKLSPNSRSNEESDKSENLDLSTNVLAAPGEIVSRLAAADGPPRVNIPLPGWVWNLERRKQWGQALEAWRAIEHVVIFVELPPASEPEAVLLAENVPNLLWLVDSGKSDAAVTHIELETLRDAHCNLVGAVLNRESAAPVRGRFTRWLGSSAFLLIFALCLGIPGAQAQTPAEPAAFSVVTPQAGWQKRLTLGPGDVLTFHLFGSPELTREQVPIGPDGRVSYLEAENIVAAGLTVDELRDRLNSALGQYRRGPQVFVTPVAYRSKRYHMLGTVVDKGTFTLDRPITVIEAVARARGFETGMSNGDVIETTDFSRAFLARAGKHMPVDFEKLFVRGDLSQNIALEPNDYLFFPSSVSGEIYVLGEVRGPGPTPSSGEASVLSVIADRGGFTDRAWRERVLVVRGSLDHPQTFKVDIEALLRGEGSDFSLQPGDIVYVSNRPWIRVEELLDAAATAFVESAVVAWTDIHVGPAGTAVSSP